MPYSDREQQLDYLREYYAEYRQENEAEIKARQKRWFRNNKQHVVTRRRVNRALARCRRGFEALCERDAAVARMLVVAHADEPQANDAELRAMAKRLPAASRKVFVRALDGVRTRNFWGTVLEVET